MFVEGLIHVTSLRNDYYQFDPVGHRLHGERSGQIYRLGDSVKVRVARVDLDERKIDFEPIEPVSYTHLDVYKRQFPDRAIPMLPEALSNGLCSLKPDVDRLCMVCEMTFNGCLLYTSRCV